MNPRSIRFALTLGFAVALVSSASSIAAPPAFAQETAQKSGRWDITEQHGPAETIEFTTEEGTWMAVDVSPDGRMLVFDLLGDIY